jgi:hypothetical protein
VLASTGAADSTLDDTTAMLPPDALLYDDFRVGAGGGAVLKFMLLPLMIVHLMLR